MSSEPAHEQEVRRLLAEARHDGPIPEDVAARLDDVLRDLARGDAAPLAPVVPLSSHRRRRAAGLLVAAAAVVALGVGLGQVIHAGGGSATSAGSAADSRGQTESSVAGGAEGLAASAAPSAPARRSFAAVRPVHVGADHFARDVRAAQHALLMRSSYLSATSPSNSESAHMDSAQAGTLDRLGGARAYERCVRPAWGPGRLVPARYAGAPAVLVFRPTTGDTRVVDLFACGGETPLRSVTLPVHHSGR
ncbi:MAG: hypothetical protein ACXVEJ_06700 [Nocardioides sp.]